MSEQVILPKEVPPVPKVVRDEDKEAAIRAATYYDRVEAEREQHRQLLEQSKVALEVQMIRMGDLRQELDCVRGERDALMEECVAYRELYANLKASLARFELPDVRRAAKRNGKHKPSDTVSDSIGSAVEVALDPSVLASGS